jgi:hypothetical protein
MPANFRGIPEGIKPPPRISAPLGNSGKKGEIIPRVFGERANLKKTTSRRLQRSLCVVEGLDASPRMYVHSFSGNQEAYEPQHKHIPCKKQCQANYLGYSKYVDSCQKLFTHAVMDDASLHACQLLWHTGGYQASTQSLSSSWQLGKERRNHPKGVWGGSQP